MSDCIVVRFTPLCGFKNKGGVKLVQFTSVETPVTLRFATRESLRSSVELLKFLLNGVPGVDPMRETFDRDAIIGHLLERFMPDGTLDEGVATLCREHILPYLEENNRYYVRWAWGLESEETRAALTEARLSADRGDLAGEFQNLYTFLSDCVQTSGVTRALQLTLVWLHLRTTTTAIECKRGPRVSKRSRRRRPLTFWDIVANVAMTSLKSWLLQSYDIPCVLYATKVLLPSRVYAAIATKRADTVDWGAQIKRLIRELCKRSRCFGGPSSVALTRRVNNTVAGADVPYFDRLVDMYSKFPSHFEPFLEYGEEFAFSTVLCTYLGLRPRLAVLLNYYRWRVKLFASAVSARYGEDEKQRLDCTVWVVIDHMNKICEDCINCNFILADMTRSNVIKELVENLKYLTHFVNDVKAAAAAAAAASKTRERQRGLGSS